MNKLPLGSTNVMVKGQRGFSLVELMIAITLGLLLIAAVGSIYLSSSRSYRTQGSVSQVQEEGRFANLLVVPIVRQAGYLPSPVTQIDPSLVFQSANNKLAVMGVDNSTGSLPAAANFPGFDPSKVVAGTDIIAIAFEGRPVNVSSTVTGVDTALKTCLGRSVDPSNPPSNVALTTPLTNLVAVNIFFIRNDDSGVPSLYCYDNITAETTNTSSSPAIAPQPLVSGVTDMQILYGLDSGTDFVANQYVTAAAVTDWTKVASVQLTFFASSLNATEGTGVNSADATNGVSNGKITHSFTTIVQIRNRLHV